MVTVSARRVRTRTRLDSKISDSDDESKMDSDSDSRASPTKWTRTRESRLENGKSESTFLGILRALKYDVIGTYFWSLISKGRFHKSRPTFS